MVSTTLSAISALANIVLGNFHILFKWGLRGAAIATVLSQFILVIGGIYVVRKYSTESGQVSKFLLI